MNRQQDYEAFAFAWVGLGRVTKRAEPYAGVTRDERLAERRAEIEAYWQVLEAIPLRAVLAASRILMRQEDKMPSAARWGDLARGERRRAESDAARVAHTCEACDNTGWADRTCSEQTPCGRSNCRPGHTFVIRCSCRTVKAAIAAAAEARA